MLKRRSDRVAILTVGYSIGVALIAVLAAAPFMSRLRELLPLFVLASLVGSVYVVLTRGLRARVAVVTSFSVALGSATVCEVSHAQRRAAVLASAPEEIEPLSRHLLIGYRDRRELEALLERFDFAGVFVTARNAAGKSRSELAEEIASFQAIQKKRGRAPLLIATDQEGGSVARLSGPLPWRASLAAVGSEQDVSEAAALGAQTGTDLASLGVTVNFAPVIDLKFGDAKIWDRHSRIAERAITGDPARVASVATAYVQAMHQAGVLPVAKHFPGLGRLSSDTHVTDAVLATPKAVLAEADWLPFSVLAQSGASAVMVGHAIASAVDTQRPASLSHAVVSDVLRGELHHEGLVFSDDLCMAPTYRRGIAASAHAALAAGVDVLLVTYDMAAVYEVLAAPSGHEASLASDLRVLQTRLALASAPTLAANVR
jgi:beta-N-acetylhexosaminidase